MLFPTSCEVHAMKNLDCFENKEQPYTVHKCSAPYSFKKLFNHPIRLGCTVTPLYRFYSHLVTNINFILQLNCLTLIYLNVPTIMKLS